jgi:hypothetical protein
MATRRGRGRFAPGAERRRTDWARQSGAITVEAGDLTYINLLDDYVSDGGNLAGVTVARTHLRLSVTSDVTAGDTFYWGMIAGPTSYVGTNLTGVPGPEEDPYADWAMWENPTASLDVLTGTGYGRYFGPANNRMVDLRAKRKLSQLQTSWLICVLGGTIAATTLVVNYSHSTLLMLP